MPQASTQTTTTVSVRVDESVKRNVEALFDSMGMNISTAVNMFFKQCLLEEALPFQPKAKREMAADPFYSEANMARLRSAIADAKADKNMTEHELVEVADEENLA